LGQVVAQASGRFWAAGEVRALARWQVLVVQRFTPTSFGTDIVVTRLNVDGDGVSTVTL
jgi:glucose uptake protein GlcU